MAKFLYAHTMKEEHFGGQITITDRVVNYPGIASISGAALTENMRQRLLDWDTPCHLRIFVSLSCTLCPELVTAAQRLATLNPRITTDVYDLNLYPSLREAYQVMSVPCFLINEDGPHFGKKTAAQLLNLMEAART
ncbi:thioredoxin family protein [Mitsuokella multacida]|uniref:thioredoxin family protein n=1 Tax=Mitsuokella multacida TaxID=52226 RepID=UPI003FA2C952